MEFTLDQALQRGVEAHKTGELQEADRYYTAIIKANSKHPDANHNMGILAVGVGKVEVALPFFKTALQANPSIAQFWLSYIDALLKLDRRSDAKAVFEQAKNNGAKGDGFDRIEKSLGGSGKDRKANAASEKLQEPSQEELNSLVKLYNQNKMDHVFKKAQEAKFKKQQKEIEKLQKELARFKQDEDYIQSAKYGLPSGSHAEAPETVKSLKNLIGEAKSGRLMNK